MGLNSVDVTETSGSGSENEIENPKAFVFVAFDSLVVAKDGDAIGERVVVNVNETGAKEGDCSVNAGERYGDVNGKRRCRAVSHRGE